jgi:DNA-binding PadR family transcriptional regulator
MVRYPILENMIWLYSIGRRGIYPYKIFREFRDFGVKEPNEKNYYTYPAVYKAFDKLKKEGWLIKCKNNRFKASLEPLLKLYKKWCAGKNEIRTFKEWFKKHHRFFNFMAISDINEKFDLLKRKEYLLGFYHTLETIKFVEEAKEVIGEKSFEPSFNKVFKDINRISHSEYEHLKKFRKGEKTTISIRQRKFYKSANDFIKDYEEIYGSDTSN